MADYIPLSECKHGGLYKIHSRNLSIGVFNEDAKGFIGIRNKFDYDYLFTEFHWDTGPPFGTVQPHELLDMYPGDPVESITRPAIQEDVDQQMAPKLKLGEETHAENADLRKWLEEKATEHLGVKLTIKELMERDLWNKAGEIMAKDEDAGKLGSRSAISNDTTPIQFTRGEAWQMGITE